MTTFDTLIERNQDFASHEFSKDLSMMPTLRAMIIGCLDPRVDPAHLLGLKPGEAIVIRNVGGRITHIADHNRLSGLEAKQVIRNVGGRITPGTLETMGMLGRIAQVEGANPREFHLMVLQHTHCGIASLEDNPEMLASYFGIGEEDLSAKAITDPRAAVAVDVATLKTIPALPASWQVSGLVYDVETGLVEVVVPPAPLRHSESNE